MSERPRLAFVLQKALGWNTYRRQLEAVLAARDDIEALVVPVSRTRRETLFDKRNNMSALDRWYRRRDPIDAFAGKSGSAIRAALRDFRPGAVHFAAHWPAAALGDPVPFTCALDNTREGIERSLPRGAWSRADMARESALLRRAARVYPMSRWAGDSVTDDCGVPAARVTVMPPPLDLARFVPPQPHAGGPLRVLFIGNDVRRKGLDRLAAWVAGPLAGQAELHVVSTDPAAAQLANGAGIVLHGFVANDELVGTLMPTMDVLCLPTRSDMSPQVLVEAAAAGIAAVASDVGGISDLILDGQTGLLVAGGDDAGFIAALSSLAADRARTRAMGRAGRALAEAHFDAGRNFNQLIDTLCALAAAPDGTAPR